MQAINLYMLTKNVDGEIMSPIFLGGDVTDDTLAVAV